MIDSTRQEPKETITVDHIFRLLALVYAREPLQIAHRALTSGTITSGERLWSTSKTCLPFPVWQRILPLFEEGATFAAVG